MSLQLSLFTTQLDDLIEADDEELSANARRRHVKSAVAMYSRDFPDNETDDVSGDAGKYYGIAASLSEWVEGFSRIKSIEYPAATVASDEAPQYLEPEDWVEDYWASDTRYLYLPNHAPAATEAMRISYTVPYKWVTGTTATSVNQAAHGLDEGDYIYNDGSSWVEAEDQIEATHIVTAVADVDNFTCKILATTVPMSDFFAVCHLAAALCCRAIAAHYARIGESAVAADAAAHTTKSAEFARRAGEFYDLYRQEMGIGIGEETAAKPAGVFVDLDTEAAWPAGRQFLFRAKANR